MKYQQLNKSDISNGEGVRVSLFVSGCTHKCKGCHNPKSWDSDAGIEYTKETEEEILDVVQKSYIRGLTLSGGDPLHPQNRNELVSLVKRIKTELPEKDIWIWTGYEFEEIKDIELVKYCDVAVTGRFDITRRDISDANRWRGSTNQRVIDVQASLKSKKTIGLGGIPNNEV